MKVIVDTPVWSLLFRRAEHQLNGVEVQQRSAIKDLVGQDRAVMLGIVRQEVLSGIKIRSHFELLRDRLRGISHLELVIEDYETGAECYNRCREKGIQGTATDFLICGAALRRQLEIFSLDHDFARYAQAIGVRLFAK
jgi:predicted nucleic acid-binding protein